VRTRRSVASGTRAQFDESHRQVRRLAVVGPEGRTLQWSPW
jgi:hypothetical protein